MGFLDLTRPEHAYVFGFLQCDMRDGVFNGPSHCASRLRTFVVEDLVENVLDVDEVALIIHD
jgi:hypothetical protein